MNSSFFDKIALVFKYIFSSYITIELFIFSILLFALLIINLKRKSTVINIGFVTIFFGLLLSVIVSYTDYIKICFKTLIKSIMKYVYFPSTIVYFFIILFVTCMIIYTIFSKRLTKFKRIFNYSVFSMIYLLFMLFVTISASNGIDLNNMKELYLNDTILSLVQMSNFLLLFWIVYTLFYRLYLYYKKKFD
ncbi:MAG: hypothetical protein IJI43_03205 [Bacilli bacterium]|nr:hypothetical protein [Bacilli bacterium]